MTNRALILTKYGWRNIYTLNKGIEVVTLNPYTMDMEFKPITNFEETTDKNLTVYKFNQYSIRDMVTETTYYPLYGKGDKFRGFFNVKDIIDFNVENLSHLYLTRLGNWNVPDNKYFNLKKCNINDLKYKDGYYAFDYIQNDRLLPLEEFMKFIGMYLTIGATYYSLEYVFLYNIKPKLNDDIKEILDNLNLNYEIITANNDLIEDKEDKINSTIYLIKDASLYYYLKDLGDCYTNYIPSELKNQSQRLLQVLFDSYKKYETKYRPFHGEKIRAISASQRLILDFIEIFLKLGSAAIMGESTIREFGGYFKNKLTQDRNTRTKDKKEKRLFLLNESNISYFYMDKRFLNITKVNETDYPNLKTYSMDNDNHTFYIMQNGRAHWIGNS